MLMGGRVGLLGECHSASLKPRGGRAGRRSGPRSMSAEP